MANQHTQLLASWLPTKSTWCKFVGENHADPESTPADGDVRCESHEEAVEQMVRVLSRIKVNPAINFKRVLFLASPENAKLAAPHSDLSTQQGRGEAGIALWTGQATVLGLKLHPRAVGWALIGMPINELPNSRFKELRSNVEIWTH